MSRPWCGSVLARPLPSLSTSYQRFCSTTLRAFFCTRNNRLLRNRSQAPHHVDKRGGARHRSVHAATPARHSIPAGVLAVPKRANLPIASFLLQHGCRLSLGHPRPSFGRVFHGLCCGATVGYSPWTLSPPLHYVICPGPALTSWPCKQMLTSEPPFNSRPWPSPLPISLPCPWQQRKLLVFFSNPPQQTLYNKKPPVGTAPSHLFTHGKGVIP
jgi:hypothetical protein